MFAGSGLSCFAVSCKAGFPLKTVCWPATPDGAPRRRLCRGARRRRPTLTCFPLTSSCMLSMRKRRSSLCAGLTCAARGAWRGMGGADAHPSGRVSATGWAGSNCCRRSAELGEGRRDAVSNKARPALGKPLGRPRVCRRLPATQPVHGLVPEPSNHNSKKTVNDA
jgi:hypothetical protein